MRVIDLARRMVELSGRTVRDADRPDGEFDLRIAGLRPGDKLYKELLIGDNAQPTQHPRVMKAHEKCPLWVNLKVMLASLKSTLERKDVPSLKLALLDMLPGYLPEAGDVDWVHQAHRAHAAFVAPPAERATRQGLAPDTVPLPL